MKIIFSLLLLLSALSGCANTGKTTLYDELGGKQAIASVVDNFIHEIEFNETLFRYFAESDIARFREKMNEHLCVLAKGPCEYTGDTMEQVHAGMNITEADFNLGVDLFIQAMNKAKIPHPVQNKLLAKMVPTRKEIIYL
ncbi:MAG: group 1 truncated hemoglobin [Paraglaciecola sp.]|uniref:group I truncated hemoglobin n=1 Tax=Paraglaciecola sp. TaxID=1920173 RepID=UPI00273DA521|nr:group 1 truncated hemoglobin [Paraglaciecola sp.]MDP5032833.1 group 1 truncated hemoglobin [Paraglaciecola sp.]MDP5129646.1 group 1 truncated hemoglobin [Paraglaciecola sp.]